MVDGDDEHVVPWRALLHGSPTLDEEPAAAGDASETPERPARSLGSVDGDWREGRPGDDGDDAGPRRRVEGVACVAPGSPPRRASPPPRSLSSRTNG